MDSTLIEQAEAYLSQHDPILGAVIAGQKLEARPVRHGYFVSLCRSIIGQQVSVAAAAAISGRFESLTKLQPTAVASMDDELVKTIGLSKQKAGYLRDLGGHFAANPQVYDHLGQLEDQAVIDELVAVKGIGVWTAQMFLMFTLCRPDVFAPDDIGLQNAMLRLYEWPDDKPRKADFERKALAWQPYRTVASLHLWQSLHNQPQ